MKAERDFEIIVSNKYHLLENSIMQGLSIIGTKQISDSVIVQLGRTGDGVWMVWTERNGNLEDKFKTDRESDAWGQWGLRIKALQD